MIGNRQSLGWKLRAADGRAQPHIQVVPELWSGLSRHPEPLTAARELLRHCTTAEQHAAMADVPARYVEAIHVAVLL
ncbi:hypothetical protein [Streptomyces sp. NPDC024089]|uniref:hypothetical protein n=1 Tax=Streptomyces sp. NPDC024089 TaxID=3154328 RepID=UPI00340412D3